jgi:hypothetical protein
MNTPRSFLVSREGLMRLRPLLSAGAHQLLQTVFPRAVAGQYGEPVDEIRAELMAAGRREGELEKTKADGTRIIVASRWSLRRDERERPVAILETNNDISERKRAEREIRRLNQAEISKARSSTSTPVCPGRPAVESVRTALI